MIRSLFYITFTSLLLLWCHIAVAQEKWKLTKDENGIRVYQSTDEHKGGFKKIRVEMTTTGSVERMTEILKDVSNYKNWVYSNKSGTVLRKINENEYYFHTVTAMPWPVMNRDAVVRVRFTTEANRTLTVVKHGDPKFIPVQKDKVRVPHTYIKWIVAPAGPNQIRIQYHFEADPGGTLPAWVVNAFAELGPVESFRKLAVLLAK